MSKEKIPITGKRVKVKDLEKLGKVLEKEEEKIENWEKKLAEFRTDIGDELFNSLSDEDKKFIIETEGIVDLGYEVSEKDLKRIMRYIEEDE